MPVQLEEAIERARARIGTVLKQKWRLDTVIGVGGMAAVYAATDRNQKRAAIKMLHPELSVDPAIRQRFSREGYVANSIGHRGAVSVADDDVSEDGLAYLVMELLEGETIEQRWQRKGRILPALEVLSVMDQLLDTLAAAHARGIVHRDLKPENLFLTRDGAVKVLDFGIARVRELTRADAPGSARLITTQAGSAMGTPAFMAPEQARGKWDAVDGRTDLWSVGATLYTLLTGAFVHKGETASETLAMAVTRPARSIAIERSDLHPSLIRLVDRALAYDKAARFADATTMQHALRVTYAEMQGRDLNNAPQLQVPDLESVPSSRAVTLRNVATVRAAEASGQPTARARRASDRRWLTAAAAFAFALLMLWLARARRDVTTIASPVPSDLAVQAIPTGAPPPTSSAQAEPKPVPVSLDDLPKEPAGQRVSRPGGSKRPNASGVPNSKRGSGEPRGP